MKLWFVVPLDAAGKLKPEQCRVCFSAQEAVCVALKLKAAGFGARIIAAFFCGSGY